MYDEELENKYCFKSLQKALHMQSSHKQSE